MARLLVESSEAPAANRPEFKSYRRVARAAVFCGLAIVQSLSAQNLLQNGDFDFVLDPWLNFSAENGTSEWNALDADGDPMSGSVLITNTASGGSGTGAGVLHPDFVLEPNSYYVFGYRVLVPIGETVATDLSMEFQLYHGFSTECYSFTGSSFLTYDFEPPSDGLWRSRSKGARTIGGTNCARIALETYPWPLGTAFHAHFDDVFLIKAIFADGFERGDMSEWSSTDP